MAGEGGFGFLGPEPGQGGAFKLPLASQGLLSFAPAASKIPLEIPRGPGSPEANTRFPSECASAVHTHLRLR